MTDHFAIQDIPAMRNSNTSLIVQTPCNLALTVTTNPYTCYAHVTQCVTFNLIGY